MTTDVRPARAGRSFAAVLVAVVAGTAACGTAATPDRPGPEVMVSAPPLAYLAERVAGADADVTSLVPPGGDPHSQEISPATLAELASADLVVYVSGLQPAVDEAAALVAPSHAVDVLDAATAAVADGGEPPDPGRDPHFWLDPVRFGLAAGLVADALAEVDPDREARYRTRAQALVDDLELLDEAYREVLAPCAGAVLVTSHEAFGYLAARYDLEQQGLTGVDPAVEPSPARLREVRDLVLRTGVRTIFFETAAAPGLAHRLADDLGVGTAVLDPMERTQDLDYLATMRTNLDALAEGLVCED